MLKRLFIIMSISSLIIAGVYSIYEYTSYTLKHSEREITSLIQEQLELAEDEPLLLEVFQIDDTNKVVATFEYNQNELGAVIFQKGIYGKLKLEKFLLDHPFYSEIIKTKSNTRVLFIGENLHSSVKTIETDIESQGERVKIAVPPQKYFTHIGKVEDAKKVNIEPTYIYRSLNGALSGTGHGEELEGMELMFVDESNQSFLIYSEKDSVLKTVLGGYRQNEDGFVIAGYEEPDYYSMTEEKAFCFEEKKVKAHLTEQTYLHGLVPKGEQVQKVVLEVERKEEVIYQFSGNVIANQFLIYISHPEVLETEDSVIKKFHFYDKDGNYIRTEMKS